MEVEEATGEEMVEVAVEGEKDEEEVEVVEVRRLGSMNFLKVFKVKCLGEDI